MTTINNGVVLLDALTLGVGQTWQNVTASRVMATNYTNTTGRPIFVSLTIVGAASLTYLTAILTIGGAQFTNSANGITGTSSFVVSGIVPDGGVYSFGYNSNVAIGYFVVQELR